jgi:hypothetical protein
MSETETKSEATQLTLIAAQILSGLLASGDYTVVRSVTKESGYGRTEQGDVRREAIRHAIDLAKELIEKTNQ